MKKVWSVIINGKNDQVIMDDAEAMIVKMKFMPDIEMFDLTTLHNICLLYTSPSPRDGLLSRMPSSA